MRHGTAGFQQHERMLRRGDIRATAGEFVGKREHVVNRIVATQRELEARFAFLRAVAGALIATELRRDGHDVAHVIRLQRHIQAVDISRAARWRCGP